VRSVTEWKEGRARAVLRSVYLHPHISRQLGAERQRQLLDEAARQARPARPATGTGEAVEAVRRAPLFRPWLRRVRPR